MILIDPPHVQKKNGLFYLQPEWSTLNPVRAYTSTRQCTNLDHSDIRLDFNLAFSNATSSHTTHHDRQRWQATFETPSNPFMLAQTHSNHCIQLPPTPQQTTLIKADAAYTNTPDTVCAVLTADCLPLLVTTLSGDEVAAIHAGWRGLLGGVIENTLAQFQSSPDQWLIWLGPAISQPAYEINAEIRQAFIDKLPISHQAFQPSQRPDHYLADLYLLAKLRLQALGVKDTAISGGHYCTFRQKDWFHSYRREGKHMGHMLSTIWIHNAHSSTQV